MIYKTYIFVGSLLFYSTLLCAQIDTVQQLPEVVVSDVRLSENSQKAQITVLPDSVIQSRVGMLSNRLQYHTLLYARENGVGGVSSPSLRGTTAQQTLVVWNGITINSPLNGQADLNTLSGRLYNQVQLRSGGGSVLYGSGAIGGSIHLNNAILFKEAITHELTSGFGSFDTFQTVYKGKWSSKQFYADLAIDYLQSENDFRYLNSGDLRNQNGQFQHLTLNQTLGIDLGKKFSEVKHYLKAYHNSYWGDRNFSGTQSVISRDGYEDNTARTLAVWQRAGPKLQTNARIAHIYETYRYYFDITDQATFNFGKAIRYTAAVDGQYTFSKKRRLKSIVEFTNATATGSNINKRKRNTLAVVLLWKDQLSKKVQYQLQLREEVNSDFETPLIYGFGINYQHSKYYSLSMNGSRNFRVPTFNDLYWRGIAAVGNPALIPETSWQATISNEWIVKKIDLGLNLFYIESSDLIQWRPFENNVWRPVNVNETTNYGIEFSAATQHKLGSVSLNTHLNYGYTVAKNRATDNQLIYTPKHKATGRWELGFSAGSIFYEALFHGTVFTTTDNRNSIPGYTVSNIGLTYPLSLHRLLQLNTTLRVNNILNTDYQMVAFRPNPGRNFSIQTTYNF